MRRATLFVFLILILSLCTSPLHAANWYVWKGATGSNNGTSWTNAWAEMNKVSFSSVACGDTVWLGGGSYTTALSISKTCTAGSPLLIQSVLVTDGVPTSALGYTPLVLAQVLFSNNGIDFTGGAYITLSGRQGSPGLTPFGILSQCTLPNAGCFGVSGAESGSLTNITMAYVESYGPPCVAAGSCTGNADGVNMAPSTNKVTNLLLDHDYLHQWAEIVRTSNWTGCTIQYSWIAGDYTTKEEHADVVYSYPNINFTMRYNTIWSNTNDGIFFDYGGSTNFQFYGNVYFHSGGELINMKAGYSWGTIFLYNNVFENDGTFGDYQPGWLDFEGTMAAGSFVENNVFENITVDGKLPGTADYNAWSSSIGKQDSGAHSFTYNSGTLGASPLFIGEAPSNPPAANFRLTSEGATTLAGGVALAAPYNVDPDGNARGGPWYIGAFQYGGSAPPPPPPPTLSLTTSSLPGATVGTAYTTTLAATGGTQPYTFTVSGLPAGLVSSGATISGTPTAAGTSSVGISVSDASTPQQMANITLPLVVSTSTPPPPPCPTCPPIGSTVKTGTASTTVRATAVQNGFGAALGTVATGSIATVVGGPSPATSSYWWMQIHFATCTGAAFIAANCTGWMGSNNLTVTTAVVVIAITPATANLNIGQTQQFAAAVTNATDTSVTWSTNAPGGLFAATTSGTFTVIATSNADPTKSASATVKVAASALTWNCTGATCTAGGGTSGQVVPTQLNPPSGPTGSVTLP